MLGLAHQDQVVARLVAAVVVVVAAVFDRQRRCDLLAVVADDPGERPELLLLLGRHPALDDDVVRVLRGEGRRGDFVSMIGRFPFVRKRGRRERVCVWF